MFAIAQAGKKASGVSKAKQAIANRSDKRAKERLDKALDEALEQTFPASDPVAITQPGRERPDLRSDGSHHGLQGTFERQPASLLASPRAISSASARPASNLRRPSWSHDGRQLAGRGLARCWLLCQGLTDWRMAAIAVTTALKFATPLISTVLARYRLVTSSMTSAAFGTC